MQQESNQEQKRRLRERVEDTMASLALEDRLRSDEALRNAFFSLPELAESQTILLYYGVGTEVDTRPLLNALSAQGKRVLLPRCLPRRQMEARQLCGEAELISGVFGIPEPSEQCPVVPKEAIDLILVPALCCDRSGYRLGKGGGYYDRYLADYSGRTVAFCRKLLLQEALPWEDFDQPVSMVLTEEGLVRSHTG